MIKANDRPRICNVSRFLSLVRILSASSLCLCIFSFTGVEILYNYLYFNGSSYNKNTVCRRQTVFYKTVINYLISTVAPTASS